jgi:hypothetical protein
MTHVCSVETSYGKLRSISDVFGKYAVFLFALRPDRPPLWSDEFLATGPEVRVRFPTLPDFLRSNGSGTGPTQPREYN